jgi:hypothetical protein
VPLHRAPVGFQEEVGTPPILQCAMELKAKDPIRLHAQPVWLAIPTHLDLPAEREAPAPGRFRCPRNPGLRPGGPRGLLAGPFEP